MTAEPTAKILDLEALLIQLEETEVELTSTIQDLNQQRMAIQTQRAEVANAHRTLKHFNLYRPDITEDEDIYD